MESPTQGRGRGFMRLNLTAKTFGRLTVTQDWEIRGINRFWRCLCLCGKETWVRSSDLTMGRTNSCGCLALEWARTLNFRHVHSALNSRTYHSWQGMLNRCRNKNLHNAHRYVERGITVCDRWHRFEHFLADMGECPAGKALDRFNNELGYTKGNCHWASSTEQGRNTSHTKLSWSAAVQIALRRLKGEKLQVIARDYGISHYTVRDVSIGRTWKGARLTAALKRCLENVPCN